MVSHPEKDESTFTVPFPYLCLFIYCRISTGAQCPKQLRPFHAALASLSAGCYCLGSLHHEVWAEVERQGPQIIQIVLSQQGVIASGCLATDHVSNMIPSFSRHCSFFLELKKNSAGHLRSPLRSLQRNCQSIVTTAMFSLDQSSKWRVIFSIISKCKKNYILMATGTSSFGFLTEQKVFWKAMKMSPPSQIIP